MFFFRFLHAFGWNVSIVCNIFLVFVGSSLLQSNTLAFVLQEIRGDKWLNLEGASYFLYLRAFCKQLMDVILLREIKKFTELSSSLRSQSIKIHALFSFCLEKSLMLFSCGQLLLAHCVVRCDIPFVPPNPFHVPVKWPEYIPIWQWQFVQE